MDFIREEREKKYILVTIDQTESFTIFDIIPPINSSVNTKGSFFRHLHQVSFYAISIDLIHRVEFLQDARSNTYDHINNGKDQINMTNK